MDRVPFGAAIFRAPADYIGYSHPGLQRYGLQAVPPIHTLVKHGNAMLEGVVAHEGDKNIANIRARGVSGAFSVVDHLHTDAELRLPNLNRSVRH